MTVIPTAVRKQEADGFNTAGVTMKCRYAGLGSNIPQCNVLVSAGSHKLVLTWHPVHVKYGIPMCLPIYNQQTNSHKFQTSKKINSKYGKVK